MIPMVEASENTFRTFSKCCLYNCVSLYMYFGALSLDLTPACLHQKPKIVHFLYRKFLLNL